MVTEVVTVDINQPGKRLAVLISLFWVMLQFFATSAEAGLLHNSTEFPGTTKWGGDWGTATGKYGAFTCATCHNKNTGNIKRVNQTLTAPDTSTGNFPGSAVTFKNVTGFGNDSDNHTSSKRVCEACHSQTKHHRYDTTGQTDGKTHNNGQDCIQCHNHDQGFYASCTRCHGNPPADTTIGTATGLASPATGATSPASPGAHQKHAVTQGMNCPTCHNGGSTNPLVSNGIRIGFNANGTNWPQFAGNVAFGSFSGHGPLSASYPDGFVSTSPGTTVKTSTSYNNSCNVYCHGNWSGSGKTLNPSWTSTSGNDTACGACHSASTATPPTAAPVTGSHTRHTGSATGNMGLGCSNCHTAVAAGNFSHVTGTVDWNLTALSGTYKSGNGSSYTTTGSTGAAAPSSTYGSCNNIYCHSTIQGATGSGAPSAYATPTWGGASLSCSGCHLDMSSSASATGSHVKHAQAGTAQIACSVCHGTGFTATTVSYPTHVNNTINLSMTGIGAGTTYSKTNTIAPGSAAYGTCSTSYCHSTVQSTTGLGAGTKVTTAAWGSGALTCGSCHVDMSSSASATGSHVKHAQSATYNIDCSVCHGSGFSATTVTYPTHVNNSINLAMTGNAAGTTYSKGTAIVPGSAVYGTCNASYCHSNGQSPATYAVPTWGAGALPSDCSGCHGGNRLAATKIASNAHLAHINYTTSVGRVIGCAECHAATANSDTSIGTKSNHVDKNINVKFDNAVNLNTDNATGPTYNGSVTTGTAGAVKAPGTAVGSCASLYCHSDGNINGATPGFKTIAWNAAAIGCDGCHGNQAGKAHPVYTSGAAGSVTANSHVKHVETNNLSCDYCHAGTTSDTAIPPTKVNTSNGKHLNRTEDVQMKVIGGRTGTYDPTTGTGKTCANTYCHGTAVSVAWGGTTTCASCHGADNSGALSAGATAGHGIHYNSAATFWNLTGNNAHTATAYAYGCKNCHSTTSHATGPASANSDANVGGTNLTGASYVAGGTAYTDSKGFRYTYGSCSNTATGCHSDGKLGAPKVAVAWNTAKSANNCGVCHNKRTDTTRTWSAAHDKHMKNYSSNTNFSCNSCHSQVAANNSTINGATGRNLHPNGAKNVDMNSWANGPTGAYNGTNCSNVYCHSSGQATPNYVTLAWATTINDCVQCHGGMNGSGVYANNPNGTALTAQHAKHVGKGINYSFTCDTCHSKTVALASTTALKNYTGVNYHVNKTRDVKFSASYASGGWNGTSCSTVYCHSDGQATPVTYASPTWSGGTLSCGSCHGDATTLTTGTHAKHVNNATVLGTNYTCDTCHARTADLNSSTALKPYTSLVTHVDKQREIKVATRYGGTGTATNCSNTACHGTTSPTWGTNNAANTLCTKCHGALGTYANISAAVIAPGGTGKDTAGNTATTAEGVGFHQAHLTAAKGYTNPIRCNECHTVPGTVSATGHIDSQLPANVTFGTIAKTNPRNLATTPTETSSANPTCSNVYCHDGTRFKNGWSTSQASFTPTWTDSTLITGTSADCSKCHGYPPAGTHSTSTSCNGCHTHVNATNDGFTAAGKALHMNGLIEAQAGESSGGSPCGGCHQEATGAAALYSASTTSYSMHSQASGLNYRHYMDNDLTTGGTGILGTSTYYNLIPDSSTNTTARRCLMCHVDHDQFKTAGKRAYNLRANATTTPTAGVNDDTNLCLSCHQTSRTKAYSTPDGQINVMPIPYPNLTYANATSVLNVSTHGYGVKSAKYADGTQFNGVCVKCHNDSMGGNGDFGPKSGVNGQYSTAGKYPRFGQHQSSIPARFAVLGNQYYQGTVSSANSTSLTVSGTPWAGKNFDGYALTLTKGTGSNARYTVYSTSSNTLYLNGSFTTVPDSTTLFEVSNPKPAVENICFSCHSKGTDYKKFASYSTSDWYGQKKIDGRLSGMRDIFVGDSGTTPSGGSRTTTFLITTKNVWTASTGTPPNATGGLVGYVFKAPGGSRTVTANTASSGGTTQITVAAFQTAAGNYQLVKPASHPLDSFGRHDSYERVTATSGWNKGDFGNISTATTTSITGYGKLWTGSDFNGMTITFPDIGVSSTINGGTTHGVITFSPSVSGLTNGQNFYIGSRHVSCADCHNTHAAFRNPEGTVTSSSNNTNNYTLVASDSKNVPGWADGKWVGQLIKVRSSAGVEQIRYISGFTLSSGTYTVSLPWTTPPDATYTYEVLMGDKWTAVNQSGGRAGSGSSGVWGTVITGGWATGFTRANGGFVDTANLTYKKIENVFDNLSSTGLGGSTIAGQRDLCIRCHSSYAFGTATPMTPSGDAKSNVVARSTDVAAEFNPNNVAHHAVYARGNNQPVKMNYGNTSASYNSYFNTSNWPYYNTSVATDTVSITNGVATFAGAGALPRNALPGWVIYVGADTPPANPIAGTGTSASGTGFLEITTITDATHFTVRAMNSSGQWITSVSTSAATANWFVSPGLGSAFVPPFGPWSILRCTDCHGSTKTDPVGPHASINKWLIKDADVSLQFEWMSNKGGSASYATVNYSTYLTASTDKGYFCFNCHRADVYGSEATAAAKAAPANEALGRIKHGSSMWLKDGSNIALSRGTTNGTYFAQYCRHCHGGDKIGGIHGSNMANGRGTDAVPQSRRFLNGATWNGLGLPTTASGSISCYTIGTANNVSQCTHHGGSTPGTYTGAAANYDYTSY
ncbi:CxxxxCH/CxxCH domain-containing protein [Geotalea sp. SG265]|uniref:CxxxxCH/CxxCH domain c-type cytochrome n=1 Tax=Geotalea sp. SG265 TaxID=2922867 RepID=UPI002435033B|nr:CxxxxCH/CxxCH domain-containing protein [Geotalea sp. SG265]